VGEHVQLKQKGREYVCVCPFHDDHKPSMYVVPAKQIYHCFSCGAGGNALDFAINYFKMDFREALKFLADRAGLELTPWKPQNASGADANEPVESGARSSRAQLFDAAAFAHDFFRTILRHAEHGKAARETIQKRAIAPEMVDEFGIGASPDRWDGLESTIAKRGMDPTPFITLGLLKRREQGSGLYDALRHRLIFPIHDQIGRVIGFGGRKIRDEDEPKYLNSPESPLFDKGRNLYGLHLARKAIQDTKTAIVTEGYTDVIACHQRGVRNVVAALGTSLTREHARLLERMCDTVVLLFDADEAGQRAADRAIEVFFNAPIDVRICVLPGGKDPDELFRQERGVERFHEALTHAKDALDFRFERLRARAETGGMSSAAKAIEAEAQRLQELGFPNLDPIRRRKVIRRLANIAGVPETDIETVLKRAAPRVIRREHDDAPAALQAPIVKDREAKALGALLADPTLVNDLRDEELGALEAHRFAHPALTEIAETFFSLHHDAGAIDLSTLDAALRSEPARRAVRELSLTASSECEDSRPRMLALVRDAAAMIDVRLARAGATDHTARLSVARDNQSRFGKNPLAFPRPSALAPPP
jgi:DNA primase